MTTVNVEVKKSSNENTPSVIRRFTKRVQSSGVLSRRRAARFYERPKSKFFAKKKKLKLLTRKQRFEELAKLGKIPEQPQRRRRR